MTPIVRRVIAGLGANAFGQAINVLIQVLSLPLFLHRWDLATYGTWLVLSAIPAYLSMADVGMVTVAGNEMTMAMGRGDVARATTVFQSILTLISGICCGLALLSVPVFLLMPLPETATLDARLALLILALGVLVTLFGGLADALFKATHRFAIGVVVANLTRLGEWAGGIAGLLLGGTFTTVAVGGLAVRLAGTIASIAWTRRGEGRDIRWGFENARRVEVVAMVRPAAAFMMFPMANALSFQGVTLLVAHLFGPMLVAVFNTYRTIARVAVQVTSIFSISLWPEFSRLYGRSGTAGALAIYRRSAVLGVWIAVGLSIALFPAAPWLLRLWTHGKVEFEPALMGLLLAYAAVAGIWHVPRVLLMSTNLHSRLAQWALLAGVAVLPAAYVFGHTSGLPGVGFAMLLAEGLTAVMCIVLAKRATQGDAAARVGVHA